MPDPYTPDELEEMERIKSLLNAKARQRANGASVTLRASDWHQVTDQLARLVILGQRWSTTAQEKQAVIDAQQLLLQELTGLEDVYDLQSRIFALAKRSNAGKMN